MPILNQKGLAHFLLPVILLLGLVAGVYLVTSGNPLKLFSKASMSQPVAPETSFTLVGPEDCAGLMCLLPGRPSPDENFEVELYARSDIEDANVFTARMNFPKDLVEVVEIKKEGSFITNWIEEYYDNEAGEIDLSGGVPDPGFRTQTGQGGGIMATIVFKAKALGKGTMTFGPDTAIYSNLNNINILTITRPYDISIEVAPSPIPSPSVSPSPAPTPEGRFIRLTYPNGGEAFKVGEKTMVKWQYSDVDFCYLGWSTGPGSLNDIAEVDPKNGYYDWTVNIGNMVPGSTKKVKLDMLCYKKGVGSVSDQSDDFFSVSQPQSADKGDGNKDGKINMIDMSVLHTDWSPSDSYKKRIRSGIDMNNDGFINSFDYKDLLQLLRDLKVIKVKSK